MSWWRLLLSQMPGVIGMNYRNRQLVAMLNAREWIAVANDKVQCKKFLASHRVPIPATLGVIRNARHVGEVLEHLERTGCPFVVKPARSARGRGVLLCQGVRDRRVLVSSQEAMDEEQFTFYALRILHGEFSNGLPLDAALVEERIALSDSWIFNDLPGAVDLRVIVREGRAVMAMARVPTRLSGGRANLHAGAVGVGIDLDRAITVGGVWQERPLAAHPDTGQALAGQAVPGLRRCLELAEQCYRAVPLGYMGVDIMWDVRRGPVVLELNARPGLAVQIANRRGLGEALTTFKATTHETTSHSVAADGPCGAGTDLSWPGTETAAGSSFD